MQYCPRCRTNVNVVYGVVCTKNVVEGADKKVQKYITRDVHCENCSTFIKSQQTKEINRFEDIMLELSKYRGMGKGRGE